MGIDKYVNGTINTLIVATRRLKKHLIQTGNKSGNCSLKHVTLQQAMLRELDMSLDYLLTFHNEKRDLSRVNPWCSVLRSHPLNCVVTRDCVCREDTRAAISPSSLQSPWTSHFSSVAHFLQDRKVPSQTYLGAISIYRVFNLEVSNRSMAGQIVVGDCRFLVYTVLGAERWFNDLAFMMVQTLHANLIRRPSRCPVDILIMTDATNIPVLDRILSSYGVLFYATAPVSNQMLASATKLQIFQVPNITCYDSIIFLDVDILVDIRDFGVLLERVWLEPTKLHVFREKNNASFFAEMYWSLPSLEFSKPEIDALQAECITPFNAGTFMFQPNDIMRAHFANVLNLFLTWKKTFFYEQSFLNYYFPKQRALVYSIRNEDLQLFPKVNTKYSALVHFTGAGMKSKLTAMELYLEKYMKWVPPLLIHPRPNSALNISNPVWFLTDNQRSFSFSFVVPIPISNEEIPVALKPIADRKQFLSYFPSPDPIMDQYLICRLGTPVATPLKESLNSQFCLHTVVSSELSLSILAGCLPVLVEQQSPWPFSELINYYSFSVIISIDLIGEVLNVLERISLPERQLMQNNLFLIRNVFTVTRPATSVMLFNTTAPDFPLYYNSFLYIMKQAELVSTAP
eukprot:gb/GEZN01003288.1/.p1 GENE.gb/GEZN01003288.1/~~gb/GEZN01003288.1/.p1  ORF type:complete len:701 (-),score=13.94 gb/GEZN01003288.1/:114-1994(-)